MNLPDSLSRSSPPPLPHLLASSARGLLIRPNPGATSGRDVVPAPRAPRLWLIASGAERPDVENKKKYDYKEKSVQPARVQLCIQFQLCIGF